MRITHIPGILDYKPGSYWRECARCGFDYHIEDLMRDGVTKSLVCKWCYDPKHPLDNMRKIPNGDTNSTNS